MKLTDFPIHVQKRIVRENPSAFGVGAVASTEPKPNGGAESVRKKWTPDQVKTLKDYYSQHTTEESFSVDDLSNSVSKTPAAVYLKASRIGISNSRIEKRPRSTPSQEFLSSQRAESFRRLPETEQHRIISERRKMAIKKFGHQRGCLGSIIRKPLRTPCLRSTWASQSQEKW